jgi:hypothetical protein
MLERLLSMLAEGGIRTPAELAGQLGVSEGLVEQMLADLSRLGYLQPVNGVSCAALTNGGSRSCAACPLSGGCAASRPGGQVWALTRNPPNPRL